jgi:hypothetical protein
MRIADMCQYIPNTIKSGRQGGEYPTHVQKKSDHYYVFYSTPIVNQKGFVGWKNYDATLPTDVVLDENAFEVLGLLQGEMSKTFRQTLTFANGEPCIINQVLTWFESAGLALKTSWLWYVRVNLQDPREPVQAQLLDTLTVQKWIELCCLDATSAHPKRLSFVSKTKNVELDGIGTLMVERSGSIFIQTILKMVADITSTMPQAELQEIIQYMRGIIAAESCIDFHIDYWQRRVLISAAKAEERKIFLDCLARLGIEARDKPKMKCIVITGQENFQKMHDLKLMTLHPEKHKQFLQMLNSYTGRWPVHELRTEETNEK